MLFGGARDVRLLEGINDELLGSIIEQEILYYKFSLGDMKVNIYGEALEKTYLTPIKFNCLIFRNDQEVSVDDFGPDLNRNISFAFLRKNLECIDLVPEVGDIVMWHESYYEVDTVRENQLFLGKDNSYNLTTYGHKFGASWSIVVDTHLTRADKVAIVEVI